MLVPLRKNRPFTCVSDAALARGMTLTSGGCEREVSPTVAVLAISFPFTYASIVP
jgi:hypothetical protein